MFIKFRYSFTYIDLMITLHEIVEARSSFVIISHQSSNVWSMHFHFFFLLLRQKAPCRTVILRQPTIKTCLRWKKKQTMNLSVFRNREHKCNKITEMARPMLISCPPFINDMKNMQIITVIHHVQKQNVCTNIRCYCCACYNSGDSVNCSVVPHI